MRPFTNRGAGVRQCLLIIFAGPGFPNHSIFMGRRTCSSEEAAGLLASQYSEVHSAAPGTAVLWPGGVVDVRARAAQVLFPAP